MHPARSWLVVPVLALITSPTLAQDLLVEKQLSLAVAQEIARGAIEKCRADGYRVAATVVDRAGRLKVVLRDDGTGPHTLDTSRRKAYTSATFRTTTIELGKRLAENPASAALKDVNDVLVLGGGVPIKAGDEVIGAIGVGGAPGGDKDEVCAMSGIEKMKDRLK